MKKIIEISEYKEDIIENIVRYITDNKIVIMPSDTIYGFLTNMENESRLREIKRRDNKPFLYIISKYSHLEMLNISIEKYSYIFEKNWPSSISFLVFDKDNKKRGVRMPNFGVLRDILDRIDKPLLSTSVNFSGEEPLNKIEDIIKNFYDYADLIVNDKNFKVKAPSTIVDLTTEKYTIIRKGEEEFKC